MKKKHKNKVSYFSSVKLDDLTHRKNSQELTKLNTKRLLAYYKAERARRIKFNEFFYCYDHTYEYEFNSKYKYVEDILNEWDLYLYSIKQYLNTRENIN